MEASISSIQGWRDNNASRMPLVMVWANDQVVPAGYSRLQFATYYLASDNWVPRTGALFEVRLAVVRYLQGNMSRPQYLNQDEVISSEAELGYYCGYAPWSPSTPFTVEPGDLVRTVGIMHFRNISGPEAQGAGTNISMRVRTELA
jgi:hypothetical protein